MADICRHLLASEASILPVADLPILRREHKYLSNDPDYAQYRESGSWGSCSCTPDLGIDICRIGCRNL